MFTARLDCKATINECILESLMVSRTSLYRLLIRGENNKTKASVWKLKKLSYPFTQEFPFSQLIWSILLTCVNGQWRIQFYLTSLSIFACQTLFSLFSPSFYHFLLKNCTLFLNLYPLISFFTIFPNECHSMD